MTIKMADVLLTKNNSLPSRYKIKTIKEEPKFASPMNPNSSTKDQQKSRKVHGRRTCNWMVQRKAKGKKRSGSMDLKP